MFGSEDRRICINVTKLNVAIDVAAIQDLKVNESQQIVSMKSEIQKLNSRLKKAEETISELMKQKKGCENMSKKTHRPSVFIKCFNMKFV